jgi:hypothetical protein
MDFPVSKDFNDKQQNRNNNAYLNYQEQNPEFAPYQMINKPKIPMSYYFPEGNRSQNMKNRNFIQQYEEEVEEGDYHYNDTVYSKDNFNHQSEELLAYPLNMVFIL